MQQKCFHFSHNLETNLFGDTLKKSVFGVFYQMYTMHYIFKKHVSIQKCSSSALSLRNMKLKKLSENSVVSTRSSFWEQ